MTTLGNTRHLRLLAAAAIVAAGAIAQPRQAAAQWVVIDPANLAQAVADQVTRALQYTLQGLEYAEAVQGVANLARQIQQLDETFNHMRDAANGRIGQITSAFSALSRADAQTLLDADFGAWRNQLDQGGRQLAGALSSMDGSSLSDFLAGELAAAADINVGQLRSLFPNNPQLGDSMAVRWERGRESGDRIRAADLATAEAAGRVTALLQAAQVDIDGRRGQGQLSHTALQQAQMANQLTSAEMQVALAQLQAIQAQQDALSRHEAELLHRAKMVQWVARERAAQQRAAAYLAARGNRRAEWRDQGRLVIR